MKRVLVTGASGFIGRNCLEPLARAGYEVHAIGRSPMISDVDLTFHQVDLHDASERLRVLHKVGPTHLLHAAWDLTVRDYMGSVENYRWVATSLDLTREFAAVGGTRALYIGTCYEYQWETPVLNEKTTPVLPRTQYGKAKAGLFELTKDLAEATGISVAWSRLFFLYGPFESRRRLVPSVISSILSGKEALTSHGRQERDYMYSIDVGKALVALFDSEVSGAVNIGTGTATPIVDLVSAAARLCGHPELLRVGALEARPGEAARVAANTERLRSEVGWSDYTPMEEGLADTVKWWRKVLSV